jgi:hypothetical protein
MSALAHIGSTVPKKLITAIVRSGEGQPLLEALANVPGVLSVSHHHARGIGDHRQARIVLNEKDVLIVLVEAEQADGIFSRLYHEGNIGQPHVGMLLMEKVLRGHPMMPFDSTDW